MKNASVVIESRGIGTVAVLISHLNRTNHVVFFVSMCMKLTSNVVLELFSCISGPCKRAAKESPPRSAFTAEIVRNVA